MTASKTEKTPRKPRERDAAIEALGACQRALKPLPADARNRIIDWLSSESRADAAQCFDGLRQAREQFYGNGMGIALDEARQKELAGALAAQVALGRSVG